MYIRPGNTGSSADSNQEKSTENSAELASAGALGEDLVVLAQADTGSSGPSEGLVVEPAKEGEFDASNITQTFTSTEGATVTLPSGTNIDRILISGEDLLIIASDGSVYLIENGALNVPSLAIDGFTIPGTALAEAVGGVPEVQPAAGPESGSGEPGSSGNSFTTPEGTIAEGFETVDLLGFTQFDSEASQFEERDAPLDEEDDTAPIFLGADNVRVEEDDLNQQLNINRGFLDQKNAKAHWEEGESGNSVGNNEDGSIDAFTATGNLNIDFQDDGPAANNPIVFTPGQAAPEGLTSDGQQITYSISADGLTLTAEDDDGVVFTVVIDPTVPGGQYTFTLTDNIDHLPTELGEELLNLGFSVTATDGDGSTTVGEFSVDIEDDVPLLVTKKMLEEGPDNQDANDSSSSESDGGYGGYEPRVGMVDEDDLNNFDPDHNSDGDNVEGSHGTDGDSGGPVNAYGSLGVLFGADDGEARSIVFNLGSDSGSVPQGDVISSDDGENGPQAEPGSGTSLTACVKDSDGNDVEIALTSKGEAVEYVLSEDGTTLLAFAGGIPDDAFGDDGGINQKYTGGGEGGEPRLVFQVSLDDDDYGYFQFTLFDQLDHPGTDDPDTQQYEETSFEDTLVLKFGFTATDSDGDSIDSELTIKVKDDVPETVPHEQVIGHVDEDDLDTPFSQGTDADHKLWTFSAISTSGTLKPLVKVGADEVNSGDQPKGKFSFQDKAVVEDAMEQQGLSSKGHDLSFKLVGSKLFGFVDGYLDRPVFKLELQENGEFKYTQFDQLDHDLTDNPDTDDVETSFEDNLEIDFSAIIEFSDFDGDTIPLDPDSFIIKVTDDVPETVPHKQVVGKVNEDDLDTDLSQGTDAHHHGNNGPISASGSLKPLVKVGADEVNIGLSKKGKFDFTSDAEGTLEAKQIASKGDFLKYEVVGNTIIAFADKDGDGEYDDGDYGDRQVFTLELSGNGHFTYTQFDQLDHVGESGDVLKIDFSEIVQFSDFDGDTIVLDNGSFVIKVKDDAPEIVPHKQVMGEVDEDDLDTLLSQGTDADHKPWTFSAISTSGSLKPLVKVGADEVNNGDHPKGKFGFQDKAVVEDAMEQQGLSSKGHDLSFKLVGSKLFGFVDGYLDRPVFKLELQENGEFKYTQFDQLDHIGEDGKPTDVLEIDFSKIVEFSDFDGDTIPLGHDSFIIKVTDDVPEVTGKEVRREVDEDNLDTDLSQGTDAHHPGNNGPISTSGSLKKLVKVGADEISHGKKGEFDFKGNADNVMKLAGLQSEGEMLSYKVEGDFLIGYVESEQGDSGYSEGDDRTVFKLELQDNGYFEYIQYDQLDHKDEHGNPVDKLEIDFSKIIEFSDFDGDTIPLNHGSFVIKVKDDKPEVSRDQDTIKVDEDGLPDGIAGGPHDPSHIPAPENKDTGNLKFKVGADEPADINFDDMHHEGVVGTNGKPITSDGSPLKYVWDQGSHTLSAITVDGHTTIFTMTITDVATGAYEFELLGPVDHPNTHKEDDLSLKLDFDVVDFDHDSAGGSIEVVINDDSPVIRSIDETEVTARSEEGIVKVDFGADGPGAIKLKDVDFEGYKTELSHGDTKLTGTQNDVKIFTVEIDPNTGEYEFTLHNDPVGEPKTTEVKIHDGHPSETLEADGVTFDGKLFTSIHHAFDDTSGHDKGRDDINPHDENGFGIKGHAINDQSHGHKKEGFEAEFNEGPVKSFSFDIDFAYKTPSVEVSYKLFNGDDQVGSTTSVTVQRGSGWDSEVPFSIEPGVAFDKVLIMFDLPHGKGWGLPHVKLNDFEYTRDVPVESEFKFEVVATDNDGDKTEGEFTVNVQPEDPTTSIVLKIVQDNHSGKYYDQHYFDDLQIKVDGVEADYALVGGQNVKLNGDDLLLTGGHECDDRIAYLRIDNVPVDGVLEVFSKYSNGDGSRHNVGAEERDGEGVAFYLDAGDGFKLIGDYTEHEDYTVFPQDPDADQPGFDTKVPRHIKAGYESDGSVTTIKDPIVIDLNGDGASLLSAADGVSFDLDADGTADQTGWVAPEDGLLVVDVDGSGSIEDGSEVFSENFNGGDFANSLDALASLDDNGDGVIDANDAAYDDILVWQDANSDGVSQDGELQSLADHGIASIDLGAQAANENVNGNHIFAEGQITLESGEVGTYVGVDLAGSVQPSESDLRQQRQIAAADAIAAAIGVVAIIDLVVDTADAATASVSTEPEHGDVTVNADMSVTYEGGDGFTGSDSFTVEFVNSSGTTEVRTVQLDVEDGVVTASAVSAPGDTVLLGTEAADTLETSGVTAAAEGGEPVVTDAVLVGGEGDDVLIGGVGDDVLTGGDGDDELRGGDGDDTLFGGAGNDDLFGDDGEDILIGGAGANQLTGGGDADVFVFTKAALGDGLLDQILDYNIAEGDTVDLSQLFDVEGGDLSDFVEYDATTGELKVDVDGVGGEDAQTIATVDTGSGPAADLNILFSDNGNTNTDIV